MVYFVFKKEKSWTFKRNQAMALETVLNLAVAWRQMTSSHQHLVLPIKRNFERIKKTFSDPFSQYMCVHNFSSNLWSSKHIRSLTTCGWFLRLFNYLPLNLRQVRETRGQIFVNRSSAQELRSGFSKWNGIVFREAKCLWSEKTRMDQVKKIRDRLNWVCTSWKLTETLCRQGLEWNPRTKNRISQSRPRFLFCLEVQEQFVPRIWIKKFVFWSKIPFLDVHCEMGNLIKIQNVIVFSYIFFGIFCIVGFIFLLVDGTKVSLCWIETSKWNAWVRSVFNPQNPFDAKTPLHFTMWSFFQEQWIMNK